MGASAEEITAPIGGVDQPDFLNQALAVETDHGPRDLLKLVKSIEADAGRGDQGVHWGPRVLDIDILLYGDQRVDEPDLQIPHPEIGNREFVLRQLRELDPAISVQ